MLNVGGVGGDICINSINSINIYHKSGKEGVTADLIPHLLMLIRLMPPVTNA